MGFNATANDSGVLRASDCSSGRCKLHIELQEKNYFFYQNSGKLQARRDARPGRATFCVRGKFVHRVAYSAPNRSATEDFSLDWRKLARFAFIFFSFSKFLFVFCQNHARVQSKIFVFLFCSMIFRAIIWTLLNQNVCDFYRGVYQKRIIINRNF